MELNFTFIIQVSNVLFCVFFLKNFFVKPLLEKISNKKTILDQIAVAGQNDLSLLDKIRAKKIQDLKYFQEKALLLLEQKDKGQFFEIGKSSSCLKMDTLTTLISQEDKGTCQKEAKACSDKLMEVINDC